MADISKKMQETLDKICGAIQKQYGKESITYLGNEDIIPMSRLSTQSMSLDHILGGGIPIGRIIELYGQESSGKSTLCYHVIAEAQKAFPDIPVALIDVEYSFDPIYASKLGVQVHPLLLSQPATGQDALDLLIDLIKYGIKVIVVDSVAALLPRDEAEASVGESQVGKQALMMSRALRKINQTAGQHKATLLFTNQLRQKIGVTYGDKTTTPGGEALKFYSSVRLKLTRLGLDGDKDNRTGSKIRVDVTKNKTYPPFKKVELVIRFGEGIDPIEPIIDLALEQGIIEKKGSWFNHGGAQLGQGRETVYELLKKDSVLFEKIKGSINIASNNIPMVANGIVDIKDLSEISEEIEPDIEQDDVSSESGPSKYKKKRVEIGEV